MHKSELIVVFALNLFLGYIFAFKHPGVLVSKSMLDFVKTKIKSHAEPWTNAYSKMLESKESSLSFEPKPHVVIECGSYSNPNIGCSDEMDSSVAAYTHSLIWYYTGNIEHANKAIDIMDAWAKEIQSHNNSNTPLQTGWTGSVWPRAGEIIKHTNASWSDEKIKRFENMLRKVYMPVLLKGTERLKNSNWHLTIAEAMAAISVFLDDQASFEHALSKWRARVPATIYLKSDGDHPLSDKSFAAITGDELVKHWFGQKTYMDGLDQETCRDLGHTLMGMAAMIDTAETAWHQGVDLYKEEQNRIVKSMEFHANYILGAKVPEDLCGGKLTFSDRNEMIEIGYNHYHNRIGVSMPKTQELITKKFRPTIVGKFMAWETLTHAENPGDVVVSTTTISPKTN